MIKKKRVQYQFFYNASIWGYFIITSIVIILSLLLNDRINFLTWICFSLSTTALVIKYVFRAKNKKNI
mgnify:CR=1 FL=1